MRVFSSSMNLHLVIVVCESLASECCRDRKDKTTTGKKKEIQEYKKRETKRRVYYYCDVRAVSYSCNVLSERLRKELVAREASLAPHIELVLGI